MAIEWISRQQTLCGDPTSPETWSCAVGLMHPMLYPQILSPIGQELG